jgi:hypothetical protein
MGHAGRQDKSLNPICAALDKMPGVRYQRVGHLIDEYDLVVSVQGHNDLWEVKTGEAKLKPSQERFMARWLGPYVIIRSPADAIERVAELLEIRNENNRMRSRHQQHQPPEGEPRGSSGIDH